MKITSNEELSDIVKKSVTWSEVIKLCGGKMGGGSYQYYQNRVKNLGFDVSHFLGKAAHAGPRQTGVCKKRHWSEILIKRKTEDRERVKTFRRVYTEYCKENKILIQCTECGNKGMWRGKKLRLQINHKDECRWNNIPPNLEWICPNCHDIKTIYHSQHGVDGLHATLKR
jgi:hypothetical protein